MLVNSSCDGFPSSPPQLLGGADEGWNGGRNSTASGETERQSARGEAFLSNILACRPRLRGRFVPGVVEMSTVPSPNFIGRGFKSDSQVVIRDARTMRQLPVSRDVVQTSTPVVVVLLGVCLPPDFLPSFLWSVRHHCHPASILSRFFTVNSWPARSPAVVR